MNRRDFVKVLAGVPLLGLVAKLPKLRSKSVWPNMSQPPDAEREIIGYMSQTQPGYMVLNADTDYFRRYAAQMGQAARQVLENYCQDTMDGMLCL